MKRLAIVTTHPIQYYGPLFRLLSKEVPLKVFYTWSQTETGPKYDKDFGRVIEWDIPLLEGYDYEFVENTAKDPGIDHYKGINNPSLISKIESWNPDAVMVIGWNFKSHLGAMRHFKGRIPVLFRGDSTLLDERPGVRKYIRRLFLRWVYRHIDYALYVGKNNKAYYSAHGVKESRLFFVPNCVDNDRFAEPHHKYEEEAGKWRSNLGIQPDETVFLFAGKLEPKKNPLFMLQLAREISSERVKFVIAGNGMLEKDLKAKSAGDKRINFLGFQNQQTMPVLYRMGDIFVLPSAGPGETWGLSINEAMACRIPVLVSDKVGCAADLVEEGKTGWIFEAASRDRSSLFNLIKNLAPDREILKRIGANAFEKIKKYSYPAAVERLSGLLGEIENNQSERLPEPSSLGTTS